PGRRGARGARGVFGRRGRRRRVVTGERGGGVPGRDGLPRGVRRVRQAPAGRGPMITRLRDSQLPVQALARLSSVVVFLVASRTDHVHLALVALQGLLVAIPYTLVHPRV